MSDMLMTDFRPCCMLWPGGFCGIFDRTLHENVEFDWFYVVTGRFWPVFRPDTTQESPFPADNPYSPDHRSSRGWLYGWLYGCMEDRDDQMSHDDQMIPDDSETLVSSGTQWRIFHMPILNWIPSEFTVCATFASDSHKQDWFSNKKTIWLTAWVWIVQNSHKVSQDSIIIWIVWENHSCLYKLERIHETVLILFVRSKAYPLI